MGFMPLSAKEFLLFGGIPVGPPYDLKKQTGILHLDPEVIGNSKVRLLCYEHLPEEMQIADRFYFNQFFPLPETLIKNPKFQQDHIKDPARIALANDLKLKRGEFVGIVGRKAFHIFDKANRRWVASSQQLGYQTLFYEPDYGDESSGEHESDDDGMYN